MILVTGATGFVGSHLLLHLASHNYFQHKIVGLYRNKKSIDDVKLFFELHKKQNLFDKIEWRKADILDVPSLNMAFEGIKYVYHCAAIVSFDPANEEMMRKTNIEGTANIVNFCLEYGVQKLCHVSSIAALGDLLPHENIVSEKTEWNPELEHSDYAISKFGAEMEVWRAQQEGLKVIVVNPGVVIGNVILTKWSVGSNQIFQKVANGLKFYSKGTTGFISVTDLVNAMKILMESDLVNQKFILVSENWDYKKLTTTIANSLGVLPPKHEIKKWQIQILWRLDWLYSKIFFKKRLLSKSMAHSLHSIDFYDNSALKSILKFEFEPLEKTIQDTSSAYFSQHL